MVLLNVAFARFNYTAAYSCCSVGGGAALLLRMAPVRRGSEKAMPAKLNTAFIVLERLSLMSTALLLNYIGTNVVMNQ